VAFASILLTPGLNIEMTPTLNQTGYAQTNLIRWRDGLVEKLGGWLQFYGGTIPSPIRSLWAWEGLNDDKHLAIGAEQSLNVLTGATLQDITPRTKTTNSTPDFSTTSGSNIVAINDPNIAISINDVVFLTTPVAVGGIVLSGQYAVATVTGTNSYTVLATDQATSTVADGGAVPVFTAVSGSAQVSVALDNHGFIVGSTFYVYVGTAVGGLTIQGAYIVQTVVDANTFTINSSAIASSSGSAPENGGDAQFIYAIAIGTVPSDVGYGVGGYGDGGYGTGVAGGGSEGAPITTTDWSMANWGEILLASPVDGGFYTWSPDSGFATAKLVVGAPLVSGTIFVAMPAQIAVSVAASIEGIQDPLLIRWSDSGDFTDWVPTTTNQAGSYRLSQGSRAVGGIQGPQFAVIWTDIAAWMMEYVGPPFIFGFNKIADGAGLIGAHAVCLLGTAVYWMGLEQFYVLDGNGVRPIPCPVWDAIFQNLDQSNLDKIRAAANSGFNEVAWYYCSAGGSGEVDSYVKYNYVENAWDIGSLARSAWIDQSVLGAPIGATPTGLIYQHEVSPDAGDQPLVPSFTTGWAEIGDGENLSFVDMVIPDFRYLPYHAGTGISPASIQVTLLATNWPWDTPRTYGPFTVSSDVQSITTRVRARQIALQIQSADFGSFWRLGRIRYRGAPDGRQ